MKKDNSILTSIIIILSLIIVGLLGYFAYDKILSNKVIENDKENVQENNNNVKTPSNDEIKEIFDFAYNYFEIPSVYCGGTDGPLVEIYGTGRYMSKKFTNYDEMLNSVKKYMTTDVIASKSPWAATTKEYYLEKDGKLYCEETYKGYIYSHGNIEIKITNSNKNKITFTGTMELTDPENTTTYDKVDVTLENINNNWIITSYEKQK